MSSRASHWKLFGPVIAAIAVIAVRLVLIPILPEPLPAIHDEFSYLLAADTFAHGRITNPPHPMWVFFESFHILQQPTYMSIFPPFQGLTLAIGTLLTGHPWAGVLLGMAAFAASAFWMMQIWLSPRWALIGALLIGIMFNGTNLWINSYYGGAVAATGGCLALGALVRLLEKEGSPTFMAIVFSIGLVILANSRPWEGLLTAIPLLGWLLAWVFKSKQQELKRRISHVLVPAFVVLAISGAALAYYCWRITGDAFLFPYVLNKQMYAISPVLIFEKPRPTPLYRHPAMQRLYLEWEPQFQDSSNYGSLKELPRLWLTRFVHYWDFFLPAAYSLLLLLFSGGQKHRWVLASVLSVFLLGTFLQPYFEVRYAAPVMGLVIMVPLVFLSELARPNRVGDRSGFVIVATLLASIFVSFGARNLQDHNILQEFALDRQLLQQLLEKTPGEHLVIVRYSSQHDVLKEWVYNSADIDQAKVVWAREMEVSRNEQLFKYFGNRQVWLLVPDESSQRLTRLR